MKTWLANLLGGGLVKLGAGVADIADKFIQTPDEKAVFQLEIEKLLQQQGSELEQSIRTELQVKERIMVAELQSGDSYTRRARPTLAYFGMAVIFVNYIVFPKLGLIPGVPVEAVAPVALPELFWLSWGGVVGVWSLGRTMERRGSQNQMVQLITGEPKQLPSILQ